MANLDIHTPAVSIVGSPATSETQGLIQIAHALSGLRRIHEEFDSAQAQIELVTGRPVCSPNCAKCCKSKTPVAWEIEAAHMVSLLYGDESKRQEIIRRSRVWLNSQRNINSGAGIAEAINTPCPFVGTTGKCLVHEGRPLTCRAYSVTRAPDAFCKREHGKGESSDSWAIFDAPELGDLRESVDTLYNRIKNLRMGNYTFLPVLVLVESGKPVSPVPVARIPFGMLWQDQADNLNQGFITPLAR